MPLDTILDVCSLTRRSLYKQVDAANVPRRKRSPRRYTGLDRLAAAIHAQRLRDECGMNASKIARDTGRTRWAIRQFLSLDVSQYSEDHRAEALRRCPTPFPPHWASPEELSGWAAVADLDRSIREAV
ncbi:hypothetical protein [Crossiella sp. S99.1]|uniref:hypothetical protein n=1 Tax=Crossiella sp. S99.1 TaxID=2936271 RepID=UPI001FFE8220|nr:hypothetical protein [Crossiella sp. S99.1]